MTSELEKGMAFMATYEPIEPAETTGRRHTGELRWNGPTLEREVEIIHYHNDRADHAEYAWEPVPQVAAAERFNPSEGSTATQAQMALLFAQKGTPEQQREALDWLGNPEPGEHQVIQDAIDGCNSGEDDNG